MHDHRLAGASGHGAYRAGCWRRNATLRASDLHVPGVPFLTDIDSRAAIKGSRDALGLVPLWSSFGRDVVGNLTTVSNSVRGFTTLLLGYHFAEAVRERPADRDQSTLDVFLRFEQLAAYARWHVNGDGEFRGHDRVVARVRKSSRVTLSAASDWQILGNQKIYGLWGLFSVAARRSGLLAPDEHVLTPAARDFVDNVYIRALSARGMRGGQAIVDLLRRPKADVHLDGRDAHLAAALAHVLDRTIFDVERAFYERHIVDGGPEESTAGRQALLASLIRELPEDDAFGVPQLAAVIRGAARADGGAPLAERLSRIGALESVLVPMDSAFGFLLSRDRQPIDQVASEIRRAWGTRLRHIDTNAVAELRGRIADAVDDGDFADRIVSAARAFAEGDYESALGTLLEQNAAVMMARGGAQPWVRLDGRRLDVRYRDETAALIAADDLPTAWRNTYFINSLHTVATTLRAA